MSATLQPEKDPTTSLLFRMNHRMPRQNDLPFGLAGLGAPCERVPTPAPAAESLSASLLYSLPLSLPHDELQKLSEVGRDEPSSSVSSRLDDAGDSLDAGGVLTTLFDEVASGEVVPRSSPVSMKEAKAAADAQADASARLASADTEWTTFDMADSGSLADSIGRSVATADGNSVGTADGDEGGRHQLIAATVSDGDLYTMKLQSGDKRWFKGQERDLKQTWSSFTVA